MILDRKTRRTAVKSGACFICLFAVVCAVAQVVTVPKVLQQGYITTDPSGMKLKIGFRLERGKLSVDREWSNGKTDELVVLFADLIAVSPIEPLPWGKWSVMVQQRSGGIAYIPFNTKDDAISVTNYLSEVSGAPPVGEHLAGPRGSVPNSEAGGGVPVSDASSNPSDLTWSPALCPPGARLSCAAFQELFDHDDPEIVRYTKRASPGQVYACFSTEGVDLFLIVQIDNVSQKVKEGFVWIAMFEHGVQGDSDMYGLRWLSDSFSALRVFGEKQSQAGFVNDSAMDLHKTFGNKIGTQTRYRMAIRWSTGKYVQEYLWKDEKGKFQSDMQSGTCVKLH